MSDAHTITGFAGDKSGRQTTVPGYKLKIWVWELLLTCCVLALLATVAKPLADGDRPLGLGLRYAASPDIPLAHALSVAADKNDVLFWPPPLHFVPLNSSQVQRNKALRAQWLNRHAGSILALLGACGWIALSLGRKFKPSNNFSNFNKLSSMRARQALIAALWCLTAHLLDTFGTRWPVLGQTQITLFLLGPVDIWLCAAGAFFLLAIIALMDNRPASYLHHRHYQHTAASPWIYPGFVFFCGLGWLWLLDWAARGHLDKQFIGIYQLDFLWLAFTLLSLVAAHQSQLLAGISRLASWLDRVGAHQLHLPNGLMLTCLLLWITLIVTAGQFSAGDGVQAKNYQRHAALLAELMRVPVWLALGWMVYRWVETGQRVSQGMCAAAALLATLMLGLKFDHDGGAMLAQTIAVIWIFCAVMQHAWSRRLKRHYSLLASWLIAIGAAGLGSAGALKLAFMHAPESRIAALARDYQGPLDFLSMIYWMLDAVPRSGFGIGNTPWCGYAPLAGLATQCKRAGVPDQIQSDYVTVALLALWGWLATLVLLTALLVWLWELMRSRYSTHTGGLNFNLLRQWMVSGFAVTSGVQIVISVAGTLGQMPLTGLAIPMLSLGGAGLASAAIFAGLSVNRVDFHHHEAHRAGGDRSHIGKAPSPG